MTRGIVPPKGPHVPMVNRSQEPPIHAAYLVGVAPPPSTFTVEEVGALVALADVTPCGLVGAGEQGWLAGPTLRSPSLWGSILWQIVHRPAALTRAVKALLVSCVTRPRDVPAAIRSGMAACWLARRVHPDIVHAQFAGPAGAAAFVWHRLTGVPYTVRAHAYDIYRPYGWAGVVLREAAGVMAISKHGADEVERRFGTAATILPVGLMRGGIRRRDRRNWESPLAVVSIGALTEKKGHDLAIEAIRLARQELGRVELDIFGEGPQRNALLQQIGSDSGIRLNGHRESAALRSQLATYDVMLMASRVAANGDMDGIPVALMEGACAGLPLVATRVAGIPELVTDGVTGTLADPSPVSIAGGLVRTATDYERALTMADAASARVEAVHDLAQTAGQLRRVWSVVVSRQV